MAVTLGSNTWSLQAVRRLDGATSELRSVFERLSTGQRINQASDDGAGLAIADSLRADSRVYRQGIRNLGDGISLLNIADSALENLSGILVRLTELSEQAANGTLGRHQRASLDEEAQALSKEYSRILQATKFNGKKLLTGELSSLSLQAVYSTLAMGTGGGITGIVDFENAGQYSVGGSPVSLAMGDFNGDGVPDIISADSMDNTLSVLLGNGDGSFGPRSSISVGNGVVSVGVGDFNSDGVLDIVSADSSDDAVSVLLGNGDGTFAPRNPISVGEVPTGLRVGDLNGDGVSDVVTADFFDDTVSVLLGNGDGTFAPWTSLGSGLAPYAVDIGDFDNDGALDIISAESGGGWSLFLGALGMGAGTFAPRISLGIGSFARSFEVSDLNGDDVLDILTADPSDNTVSVLLGNGDGTFGPRTSFDAGDSPSSVSAGDFDGDGIPDIVSADSIDGTVSVLLGNGDGTFAPRTSFAVGNGPYFVAVNNLNGDSVLDILSADAGNDAVSVLLGGSGENADGLATPTVQVSPLLPFSLGTLVDARQALPVFQERLAQLAEQRGVIGAFQSRIDVAANMLRASDENFQAAESRIRDADIATEASNMVRLNILGETATVILAQANQQPALALQLLS